jgi:hypothetical protein
MWTGRSPAPELMPSENDPVHELAKTYISLATQMHAQYDARRSLEWKIHIAVWTLLALSAYNLPTLAPRIEVPRLAITLAVFAALHLLVTAKFLYLEKGDREESNKYRKKAVELLNQLDNGTTEENKSSLPRWLEPALKSWWTWILAEFGTTVCLAVVVLMIGFKGAPKPSPDPVASLQADYAALRGDVSTLRVQYADLQKKLDQATALLQQQPRTKGAGRQKR